MFILFRAIAYATLFIGFLLVFLPARVLARSGIVRPTTLGAPQVTGVVGAIGAALALWPWREQRCSTNPGRFSATVPCSPS